MFSLLHIDNNFFYKEILRNLAAEHEFQYFSAKTPQNAYDILANHDIDIIVTGLEFEAESEEAFISTLMAVKQKTTPVVVLSAADNPELRSKLFEIGVTDFFTKENFTTFLLDIIVKIKTGDTVASHLRALSMAVLDDNETHLMIMRDILERNGIKDVAYFLDPGVLLDKCKSYNIYIIDYVLPGMSGEQVIKEIRSKDEYAVIIGISTLTSHKLVSDILQSGADDFINKPFSENLFMARIKANVRTYFLMQQLQQKNMRLAQLVKEDSLTGLYNHKCIMEILETEIDRAQRYETPLTILMFDIDHFKLVNDNYGHHLGDVVLSELGKFLYNDSRRIDIAGRYGGEEFVVILPDTDPDGAMLYANRLRLDIEAMRFGEAKIAITISGGLVTYNGETAIELIKKADSLLYTAKRNGRNCIEQKK